MTRSRLATALLAGLPLAFLAAFFVWPVGSIVATGLFPDGRFDPEPFRRALSGGLPGIAGGWRAVLG